MLLLLLLLLLVLSLTIRHNMVPVHWRVTLDSGRRAGGRLNALRIRDGMA
jgi:hypothetical protein